MNREFLRTTHVSEVMQNSGELQTVRSSDKLVHALHLLVKNRITSLPVWDETANRHRAFIDMLDILTFALKILSESDLKQGKASGYFTFLEAHDKFKSALVGDAVNLSERDLYLQVMETADLETAIRAMLDFGDLHRLPITSKEGNFRLVGLLTQSQLVRWLAGNIERFPLVKDKTIAQLEKFTKNVISIDENEVIRDALGTMQKHRISGLAVTRDGKLIGSFSSSDIKNLGDYSNILSVVMLPVSWALEEMIPKPAQGFTYPISVKPSATVTELLDMFLKTKVHRVFIVDGETLVGVCSLTDVLKIFDFTD